VTPFGPRRARAVQRRLLCELEVNQVPKLPPSQAERSALKQVVSIGGGRKCGSNQVGSGSQPLVKTFAIRFCLWIEMSEHRYPRSSSRSVVLVGVRNEMPWRKGDAVTAVVKVTEVMISKQVARAGIRMQTFRTKLKSAAFRFALYRTLPAFPTRAGKRRD